MEILLTNKLAMSMLPKELIGLEKVLLDYYLNLNKDSNE